MGVDLQEAVAEAKLFSFGATFLPPINNSYAMKRETPELRF